MGSRRGFRRQGVVGNWDEAVDRAAGMDSAWALAGCSVLVMAGEQEGHGMRMGRHMERCLLECVWAQAGCVTGNTPRAQWLMTTGSRLFTPITPSDAKRTVECLHLKATHTSGMQIPAASKHVRA